MFRSMDLKRRGGSLLAVFSVVAALAGVPMLIAAPGAAAATAATSYQARVPRTRAWPGRRRRSPRTRRRRRRSTDNDFPQWFQVDLGSSTTVGRIVMNLPPSTAWGTRTQTISIQGSTDGSAYTTLAGSAGYTFNPSTGNTVTVTFPAAQARYVKLTFTANTGWPAGQLSELQVYSS
jgi:hypothetical protein